MSTRFGALALDAWFSAWAAATSSGRAGSARRTSGSTARATGMVGVASAMAVGTGVATGRLGLAFTGCGGVAVAAATWADNAGDSTGSARGATIREAGAVGLGVALAVASAGRGAMRCRLEIKRRNQKPATKIASPNKNGTREGRAFSFRRVTWVRGAFGAGASCR